MKILYTGIDTLDVAFECSVSQSALDVLDFAKKQAQKKERKESYMTLMGVGFSRAEMEQIHVGRTGTNGYAFIFKNEIGDWKVKNKTAQDWSVCCSIGGQAFVELGYDGVKKAIDATLKRLGVTYYRESLARVDYAVDFYSENFVLDPYKFSAHSMSDTKPHHESMTEEELKGELDFDGAFQYALAGGLCTGVTVGKMPHRQMCFYNKRKDSIKKKKDFWFKVWQEAMPELDRDNRNHVVWRVEMRAGKRHLSEKLGIKTFAELEGCLADVFEKQCEDIQYKSQSRQEFEGKNYSRDVPLSTVWLQVKEEFSKIFNGATGAVVQRVRHVIRDGKADQLIKQAGGTLVSGLAVLGEMPDSVSGLKARALSLIDEYFDDLGESDMWERLNRASRRYVFHLSNGEREMIPEGMC